MSRHGKKFLEAVAQYDRQKTHSPQEALTLVKNLAPAKFDETVELHMRLGIDPRQAEQQLRGVILMPAGLGKTVRILVFAEGEAAQIAEQAGADLIGSDDVIDRIQNQGFLDFDMTVAVPDMMGKVGRVARILGPRGLMPNPKAGNVVQPTDLPRVITEARAGRFEYRNDKTGNLHIPIGKVSFDEPALMENFRAVIDEVRRSRPAAVKGTFVRRITLASTMGPGVKIDPNVAL